MCGPSHWAHFSGLVCVAKVVVCAVQAAWWACRPVLFGVRQAWGVGGSVGGELCAHLLRPLLLLLLLVVVLLLRSGELHTLLLVVVVLLLV